MAISHFCTNRHKLRIINKIIAKQSCRSLTQNNRAGYNPIFDS